MLAVAHHVVGVTLVGLHRPPGGIRVRAIDHGLELGVGRILGRGEEEVGASAANQHLLEELQDVAHAGEVAFLLQASDIGIVALIDPLGETDMQTGREKNGCHVITS